MPPIYCISYISIVGNLLSYSVAKLLHHINIISRRKESVKINTAQIVFILMSNNLLYINKWCINTQHNEYSFDNIDYNFRGRRAKIS